MDIMGIYCIKNVETTDCYIGSSKSIKKRWIRHRYNLNKGNHHSLYLQRAWNKYSKDKFEFILLESVLNKEDLFIKEIFWIEKIQPVYNVGGIGGGDNFSNNPNKEKIRAKISNGVNTRLKNQTIEEKNKRSENLMGDKNPNYKHGKSCKDRKCPICEGPIGALHKKCFACSLKERKGEKNSFYGKHHTDESKNKISKANKGRYNGNQRKKIKIDGIIYQSYSDAARKLGIGVPLIAYRVKKKYPNYEPIID